MKLNVEINMCVCAAPGVGLVKGWAEEYAFEELPVKSGRQERLLNLRQIEATCSTELQLVFKLPTQNNSEFLVLS